MFINFLPRPHQNERRAGDARSGGDGASEWMIVQVGDVFFGGLFIFTFDS